MKDSFKDPVTTGSALSTGGERAPYFAEPQDLEGLLKRDVDAWKAAKAAIARANGR